MLRKRSVSVYGAGFRRKQFFKKALLVATILIILFFLLTVFPKLQGQRIDERGELRDFFESGAFESSYTQSREMLKAKPLDFFLLTIHGFSSYQLAIAQINSFDTLSYIDDCIWSLRKALLSGESSSDGRIYYVLGKAYYYKGTGYADLAVKYLEMARTIAYNAPDIPEYLGLSYAAIGDYRGSVEAFSLALGSIGAGTSGKGMPDQNPSDVLLISIARSYMALNEYEPARAYLIRCLDISKDSRSKATARLLLGNILIESGDIAGAEEEYMKVLDENGENAEAHFQLGELYAMGGDATRARAEWRRAFRIDPTFEPARGRLNMQ